MDKYDYENRQERIARIIQNNRGLGFNELDKICSKICSRQTLHNEIKRLIEDGEIMEMPYGKQGKRYYAFEGHSDEIVEASTLDQKLKTQKSLCKIFFGGLNKMGSFEKMAVLTMLNNNLNLLAFQATYYDTIISRAEDGHDLFESVLAKIKNFRDQMIETAIFSTDLKGYPEEFIFLFYEYLERQRKKNNKKLLTYIPSKHKKIWKKLVDTTLTKKTKN